jgi:hypothetical protein
VFSWPGDAVLHVAGLHSEVVGAYLLAEPSRKLAIARDRDGIGVSLSAQSPDETDTVVVVELGGPLHLAPPIVTQGSDSPFIFRNGPDPTISVTWHLLVSQTGRYKLTIRYSARSAWENRRYIVEIGG